MPDPNLDAFGDPIEAEETQTALDEETPEPEGEGTDEEDGSSKRSKFIPRERFDQVNNKAAQLEGELQNLRAQAMQMYQMLQSQQQARQAEANPGPELDNNIMRQLKPYLDADRELDRREIAQLKNLVIDLSAVTESQRGWQYFAEEVPDWRDIGPKVIEYVESLPKSLQQAFRESPENMVYAAKQVRKMLKQGEDGDEEAVRDSLKRRAHTEGTPSGPTGKKPTKDYMSMDRDTFRKELEKIQRAKQRGYTPPDW
jgi:hypothetical protein